MNSRYATVTVLAVSMVVSIFFLPSVSGQVGGPSNPNANVTTAYKYFQSQNITSTVPPVLVTTDLKSYNQGDTIIIKGAVKNLQNQTAITIMIFSSLKNLISVAQLSPL